MGRDLVDSGYCARCGNADWVRATWVDGETICERCLPPPAPHRWQRPGIGDLAAVAEPSCALLGRRLTRDEAERLYPGRLSPDYGEPRVTGLASGG